MTATARPTLNSVAEAAQVSRQTVSNVLNSPHLVRPETQQRVREVIADLGYRPNLAARQMRTRSSRLIAMRIEPVVDGVSGVVLDRFLHALTEAAQADGYRVLLFTADGDAGEVAAYEDLVASVEVDAVVLTSTHLGDTRTAWLREHRLPFVTFGRPWGEPGLHGWVDVDGAHGTASAVDALVALGHTRIGFLGWPTGSPTGDDRRAGWARAALAAGLDVAGLDAAGEDGAAGGRAGAAHLLDTAAPTALVCASDSLALGALEELLARGLRPGADVSVVGFDDTAAARTVGLASVAQPVDQVATACVAVLRQEISRAGDAARPVLLSPTLVPRRSLAAPPAP